MICSPKKSTTSNKRILIRVFGILLFPVMLPGHFLGCDPEDQFLEVDCDECYSYEPDSANLIVYITIDSENDSVPLTFYRGSFEEGEIDWEDTATTGEFYLFSEMNRVYTVRAVYQSGVESIIAFDSDKMVLRDYGESCGYPCYIVRGGIFDLRLPR
ncbi:MAG TPA: hypothetical protein ENO20_08310 [Bacteroides sp.]|nr:hypothetical protein [Bacteroides sp.]